MPRLRRTWRFLLLACAAFVFLPAHAPSARAQTPSAEPTAPDDILLEPAEFSPTAAGPLGILRVLDRKAGATHSLLLVAGPGDADNPKFAISGSSLLPWFFDFTPLPPGTGFSIRVRATDTADPRRFLERAITLRLTQPHAPTAIRLDATALSSAAKPGALVARITVQDLDPKDTATVALVAGAGATDNALFVVSGLELRLLQAPASNQASASARLRATDSTGQVLEEMIVLPIAAPRIRINELVAANTGGVKDERGQLQDWIELFNTQPQYEDLGGWGLTDDPLVPGRWKFPPRTLAPGGFVVVLTDGLGSAPAGSTMLHAGFSLSAEGEWIGLVPAGSTVISDNLAYPRQYPGVAYGVGSDGTTGYLPVPTPAAANGATANGGENPVTFSRSHGFFSQSFDLELSAALAGSTIRYTLDGSVPNAANGLTYSGPIAITPNTTGITRGTRIVRAVALNPAATYSPPGTQTYLFVNGVGGPAIDGIVGQSRLVTSITRHPTYQPLLRDAFLSLPVVSVVMASSTPSSVERVASIELMDPGEREPGFQVDGGIAVTGTSSLGSPKLSMSARFHAAYGASRLHYPLFAHGSRFPEHAADSFKEIRLRSHSHDDFFWLGTRENPPVPYGNPPVTRSGDAQLARNPWIDEMQLAMGQPGKHGRQVHLFLNGSYHGIYHVHEHADEDYMASYYPGSAADFHFTGGATTGSDHGAGNNWRVPWNSLRSTLANYTQASRWVDVTNLCDYMLLSFYAGNDWDWSAQHNWSAAGPRLPDRGGWKFFQQDSDICLQDVNADCTDQDVPDGIFTALMRLADFRVLFRDRVQHHCFGDGMLTPARAAAAYDDRMNELSLAIIAETARWQPSSSVGTLPWDRDEEWTKEWKYLRETFFPRRTTNLLQQLRKHAGWWPFDGPTPSHAPGVVPSGLTFNHTSTTGLVYWTTDGSDPRLPGGKVNPTARTGPVTVDQTMLVRARTYSNSDWSAVVETYLVPEGTPRPTAANLILSEIQYHPRDLPDAEFLEFLNTSDTTIELADATITNGIGFRFPKATVLAPGGRLVVAKDPAVFQSRYGLPASPYYRAGVRVLGPWIGSLSNTGDTLEVRAADGSSVLSCTYSTTGEWPGRADGRGSSLELIDPYAAPPTVAGRAAWLSDPAHWRASADFHGSPGLAGAGPVRSVVLNEILPTPVAGDTDAVELLNVTERPISVASWYLSDSQSDYLKFRLPSLLLPPGGRLVLREQDFNNPTNADCLVPFALSEAGEEIWLIQADPSAAPLRFVDHVSFGAIPRGTAFGRFPDGTGPFAWLQQPTFGASNSPPSAGYEAWAAVAFAKGTPPEGTAAGADPDADGMSNLGEYAFGFDPGKPDGPPLRVRRDAVLGLVISYRVRSAAPELVYALETTADLRTWSEIDAGAAELSRVPHSDGTTAVTLRWVTGAADGGTRFLRLRAAIR